MSLSVAWAVGLAGILAWGITPLLIRLAPRIGAVDGPNHRKVHTCAMPCLGGAAIYIGFVIGMLAAGQVEERALALLAGGTAVFFLGVIDDCFELSPRVKLAGQIAAALLLVLLGVQVEFITHPLSGEAIELGLWAIPLTVLWVVGVTNAVNLIDGLDGLAAGVSMLAAVTLAVVAWREGETAVGLWALILAGSTAGFLRYNFHPARIFMGDSGAMFLGFNLAAMSVLGLTKSATAFSLIIPFVILGIPILDTFFAIVRRLAQGQPIFQADKEHLHHCLLAVGLTHRQTVLVIYAVSAVFGGSAIAFTYFTPPQAMLVLGVLSVVVMVAAGRLGVLGPVWAGCKVLPWSGGRRAKVRPQAAETKKGEGEPGSRRRWEKV